MFRELVPRSTRYRTTDITLGAKRVELIPRVSSFTLHIQPPHLYNVGAAFPLEERLIAMPAERVRLVEDVQGY